MVLSQEGQPGTRQTGRHISRNTDIPRLTMLDIIHKDLKPTFRKKRAQDLTEAIITADL